MVLVQTGVVFGGFLEDAHVSHLSGTIWRFGPFLLNTAAAELTNDGRLVAIEPQSLRLLGFLIERRDGVVSRDDLVEHIWHGRAVSDWAVSGAIKALRNALGDTDAEKVFVRTVHSRGYRFVADVECEPAGQDGSGKPTLLVRLFRTPQNDDGLTYLSEALADDLITSLSQNENLRVLSFNTTRALNTLDPGPGHGITRIVDGSLRQSGETLRINVALLDGEGLRQIWAESFEMTKSALLAGRNQIGARLSGLLSSEQPDNSAGLRGTMSAEAYDHYQKGRYAYYQYTPKTFVEALAHFETAGDIDPSFAAAFAQQAYCRTSLYVFGVPGADLTLDPAESLARKAIEIDDQSALAHARLGWILGYRGDPAAVVATFDAARERAPDSAEVYHAYGETMNRLAQPEKAAPLLETVFSKDSFFPPSWEFPQGHTQVLLGEQRRAIGHFRSVLERVDQFIPARVQLTRALWESGDRKAASREVEQIRERAPKYSLAHAARMFPYPVTGQFDRLITALEGAGMQGS
jgi:DNA-binding winged helix-turn-helix (wHTH) protein/tetratricopeptide (TPR) repeat protein